MLSHTDQNIEYTYMEETIIAIMINEINNQDTVNRSSFMEKFSLKQVIKKIFRKGYEATCNEMIQIHQITCFKPIKLSFFDPIERKISLEQLIFLVGAKDGVVESKTCDNGSVQIAWMPKEQTSSPTVYL